MRQVIFRGAVGTWTLALALVACRQSPAPPFAATAAGPGPLVPVVDVKRLMTGMIDPAADVVWQSVSITIDRTGEHDKRPATSDEWIAVQNQAMVLAESANLLMIAPRARDGGEWMQRARELRESAAKAYQTSLDHDADKLLLVGGEIYDACAACHKKYLPPEAENEI